jgi:hypothetical protein
MCHSRACGLSGAREIADSGTLRAAATREGDKPRVRSAQPFTGLPGIFGSRLRRRSMPTWLALPLIH